MTDQHAASLIGLSAFPPGWATHPVYRAGELAGFFCTLGNEIHCHRMQSFRGRWLTRQDLERLTRPLFEKYGHLTTKVRKANACGQKFVGRLGFVPSGEDETTIHYTAERLHHARI